MREYRTWEEILMERFTSDWEEAIGYLDVALEEYQEDGDTPLLSAWPQKCYRSTGGVAEVAKQAGIKAQCLSDMLASDEAPRLEQAQCYSNSPRMPTVDSTFRADRT